ncbi:MAG: ABC-type multidrug transport system [Methanophagales archaeon]|nr:ATP-binding cassette domain-containing protein [Methanophagales archaeon]MCU4139619.1 ABC-type multidrug transport system [Methanophagales archaeon]
MAAVEVNDLTKRYSLRSFLARKGTEVLAVDHISFSVEEGEIFALLGPNGAGKTTTLKILATLLKPTSGTAKVAGYDVLAERDAVRKSIGIVFQEPALDTRLTGRENLDFHARMYGLPRSERKRSIEEVLSLVELEEYADVLVSKYSGGMRRRLEIARGFVHRPKVLFLDEPTLGLDAHSRRRIWSYIKKLNEEEHTTIMLTTHYMEEADFLCSRVGIMHNGRIVAIDEPEKLKSSFTEDILTLEIAWNDRSEEEKAIEMLKKFEFVRDFMQKEGYILLKVHHAEMHIAEILETASKVGLEVKSVSLRKPSLEDVFIQLTGKTLEEW